MKNILIALFLIAMLSCTSKQDNAIIYRDFINEEWSRFDFLEGNMIIKKAPVKYDVIMEVAVSEIFPNVYENHRSDNSLLFNLTIKNPNDSGARSKDYKFSLKDKDGNWKADKKDGYYIFKLPIISEMTFGEEGEYKFRIENKYSKDPLYGIKYLSLDCRPSK
jgi:gliding motility-associated lipoprotein GldH